MIGRSSSPAGVRWYSGPRPVGAAAALDDARVLELAHALRQQAARHQRDAALQVVEAMASAQQLADDEGRPPLGQHLARLGHGTELAVAAHASTVGTDGKAVKFTS